MKKKGLLIAGGALILVVIIAIAIFLAATAKPADPTIDLTGIWKVYRYGDDVISSEYMIFDSEQVSDYRDGAAEPFISSSYTWVDSTTISMEQNKRTFTVRQVSENNVILVEPNTIEWKMFRVSANGVQPGDFDPAALPGKWNVVMHAGQAITNESMEFTETALTDYRDGAVYLESEYIWNEDGTLTATGLNHTFEVYASDDNTIILFDLTDGYLWELENAS